MGGFLFMLALVGAVLWIFASLVRRRVQSRLRDQELPEELKQLTRKASSAVVRSAGPVPAPVARAATAAARPLPAGGLHFMLIYDVGPTFMQRRAQYRDAHLALAWKAAAAGELLLAGALEEPTEQAFLLFRGSRDAARRFAESDPYVMHGLVKQWHVRQWHTVVGDAAAMPLRLPAAP